MTKTLNSMEHWFCLIVRGQRGKFRGKVEKRWRKDPPTRVRVSAIRLTSAEDTEQAEDREGERHIHLTRFTTPVQCTGQ